MKKNLCLLLVVVIFTACLSFISACGTTNNKDISVYAPDGAPALALANLLNEDTDKDGVSYEIVDANLIKTYVTYEDNQKNADVCVLPVNAAAMLLGSGENYQMLGTVTNGNLFLLSKKNTETITSDNLDSLLGKTIGVINLSNVPGLTLKAILTDHQIEFSQVGDDGVLSDNKVNLKNVAATEVIPSSTLDYFVVPEPAATLKKEKAGFSFVGNLQDLYSSEKNGYPQAVVVAKKSLIESNKKWVNNFIEKIKQNKEWLKTAETQTVLQAINGHLTKDLTPTLSTDNLKQSVIDNCGIAFTLAQDSKAEVKSYLQKINVNLPSDNFYYGI